MTAAQEYGGTAPSVERDGRKIVNGEECYTEAEATRMMIEDLIKNTAPNIKQIAASGIQMRYFLETACTNIGPMVRKIAADATECLKELRDAKSALTIENNILLRDLKEVRQFFLGPEHRQEIERLKEFVELCERLQKLKQDGTLDAVADTILRLA